jgi:hypothetical protein
MKKNTSILLISIFEIIRWIMIYFFFNYVKFKFDLSTSISGENWLWFGSMSFINILLGFTGILCYINYQKYFVIKNIWIAYKSFFLIFTIFLIILKLISFHTCILLLTPIDILILILLFFTNNKNTDKNIQD